jgi:UDP-N-acetylglucosamine transferase subunit ALG13
MSARVLIAVLNWGLGHASRSVPVIEEVAFHGADVVIASSGGSLQFLKERFPLWKCMEIPDREIKYSRPGAAAGLIKRSFQQKKINYKQSRWIHEKVRELEISHIISDNLYGACHPRIPCAIITHQVGMLSPFFKSRFDKTMAKWLGNFNEVWIPDLPGEGRITGKMLNNKFFSGERKYIGHISRFTQPQSIEKDIDVLAILSGPEPQRTFLERKLKSILEKKEGKHVLVQGKIGGHASADSEDLEIHPFLHEKELQKFINRAKLVVCRSGYSSVLDLIKLQARACLIPTPQQPEQKYLATHLKKKGWFYSVSQKKLKAEDLDKARDYHPPKSETETRLRDVITGFLAAEK